MKLLLRFALILLGFVVCITGKLFLPFNDFSIPMKARSSRYGGGVWRGFGHKPRNDAWAVDLCFEDSHEDSRESIGNELFWWLKQASYCRRAAASDVSDASDASDASNCDR